MFDTTRASVVCETRHIALYDIPREDADMSLLTRTDHGICCPFKGPASYDTLSADDRSGENAVRSCETPCDEFADPGGAPGFCWNKPDHWYEEDEEVFIHTRDPFVRIDILESGRPIESGVGGETVASTTRARFLFETGHVPRSCIPRKDVTADALLQSDLHTGCPLQGHGELSPCPRRRGDGRKRDVVLSRTARRGPVHRRLPLLLPPRRSTRSWSTERPLRESGRRTR